LRCLSSSQGIPPLVAFAHLSYFLFELPSNLLLRVVGTANWLTFIIVGWGAVTIGIGFVQSWQVLAVCRALLGVLEVHTPEIFV